MAAARPPTARPRGSVSVSVSVSAAMRGGGHVGMPSSRRRPDGPGASERRRGHVGRNPRLPAERRADGPVPADFRRRARGRPESGATDSVMES